MLLQFFISLESASALTLYLLPHMIPPKDKIKCDSGEKLKANVSEARDAFILQASVRLFISINILFITFSCILIMYVFCIFRTNLLYNHYHLSYF